MNLSELRLDEVRKQLDVDINGQIEVVNVFNLVGEERDRIKEMLTEGIEDKKLEGTELIESVFTEVFEMCTDIILDDNLMEVINKPKLDMILILHEVKEIVNELIVEILLEKVEVVNKLEMISYSQFLTLKAERLQLIEEKCENIKKDIERLKGDEDGI